MPDLNNSEAIDILLRKLESKEAATRFKAIEELGKMDSSRYEIVRGLENIAIHDKSKKVRDSAISALASQANRSLIQQSSTVSRHYRELIIAHMKRWEADGLISPEQSIVLQGRYNFDLQPSLGKSKVPIQTISQKPPQAKQSIGEILLSESTIKTALYLGAFFVIAASFIFAAVIENLRIPILLGNTAIFLGASIALRKRLPQASFVLFIIFSFMLITDASVIEEALNLSPSQDAPYWFFVTVFLAIIWGASTIGFQSPFFSLAALAALSFTGIHLGNWTNGSSHVTHLFLILIAYVGLFGSRWLQSWKDSAFARPLFLLTQLQIWLTMLVSLISVAAFAAGRTNLADTWWLLVSLNWLLAAGFFVASNIIFPAKILAYFAVASLLPVAWYFMSTFSPNDTTVMIFTWVWASLFALSSEFVRNIKRVVGEVYSRPLLIATAPLYFYSIGLASSSGSSVSLFSTFLVIAMVYAWLHFRRPRHIIWFSSLFLSFLAYLIFFTLPIMDNLIFFPGFVLLWPTPVFLAIDIAARKSFQLGPVWYISPRVMGVFIGAINLLVLVIDGSYDPMRVGFAYLIYAAVVYVYAILDKTPKLGYLASAILTISTLYFLDYFGETALMAYLISLASIYYVTGIFLGARLKVTNWAEVLRQSGLALALLVSVLAPAIGGLASIVSIALTALLFAAEAFSQRKDWAGFAAQLLLLGAYFRALFEYDETELIFFAVGIFIYYLLGFIPIRLRRPERWSDLMRASGLTFGVILSLIALFYGGVGAIVSVTLVAAAFTIEAFYRKDVMFGFPANLFYLEAYFLALSAMDISQPQFYSIGAASLGIVMHYLLAKRKINTAAFITGMLSQLILLSTTYLQMISTGEFQYFFILFFQSLAVIAYGTILRSRSLVFTPGAFLVLAVVSIIFDALSDLGSLFIICGTGFSLLAFGIIALTLRERFSKLKEDIEEKTGDWQA
ncbi:MAG: HEAT repeat domain-containing protein [Chloroflexi bacterium]|nr:HEAT repeat domain-containing protein [Chloroflexota bacterium]